MATRSRIAIQLDDGSLKSIYCHWDGYPEHNGKILMENYNTLEKVNDLISLGDISILREKIAKHKIEFNDKEFTVPYTARGEDLFIDHHLSIYHLFVERDRHEEYLYVYRDNKWYIVERKYKPSFTPLTECLE